ncbi:SPOSA6832_03278 [Sporobolomyces salmonicolor]|uniref:SPOSA6832_03278-mRNA-1:cds n=1 Tax=Sporidiobolus salmonicolor TaxID=5005 RepID=A0A0D6EPN2_SPOSA|nr:SPOSA6832_03278 [Sporobolomyces salmonicolor]
MTSLLDGPAATDVPVASQQQLIILAGVVGSGKSSLSSAWVRYLPDWARVNQDDLGDRRTCEQVVRSHLSQASLSLPRVLLGTAFHLMYCRLKGRSVILDRQNFDVGQRRTWLEIASEFPGVKVGGMVMGTTIESHPTIDNPRLALSLLDKFTSLWQTPRLDEGFDQLITLPPSHPPPQSTPASSSPSSLSCMHPLRTPLHLSSAYRRSDGFVDDGTWRPPRSQTTPMISPEGGAWTATAGYGQPAQWGQEGAAYRPPVPKPMGGAGASGEPRAWDALQGGSGAPAGANRWTQGPPHQWGSGGQRLGGSNETQPGAAPPQ